MTRGHLHPRPCDHPHDHPRRLPKVIRLVMCAEHAHESALIKGVGPRLGGEPSHEIPQRFCGPGPLETPNVRRKLRRIRSLRLVLRRLGHFPALHGAECLEQRVCTERRQAIVQGPRIILRGDRRLVLEQNGSGVQGLGDLHNRHARDRLSPNQRPGNWRRPAVFGEEGRMDIETPLWRNVEDRAREDLPEGHDREHFGLYATKVIHDLWIADLDGLYNGKARLFGNFLDGGLPELLSSSCRAIRLGHHRRHFMPRLKETGERRRGESRGPQEN